MRNVVPLPGSLSTAIASAVIADHRLHDGEAQASAVLLGGVVRREQPFALLARQSRSRNRKYRAAPSHRVSVRSVNSAAGGHRVHRIQHQIFHRAMQQVGIGVNHAADFRPGTVPA